MDARVGFRINLKDFSYVELENFIKNYAALFERYEIKINEYTFDNERISDIIYLSRMYLKTNFSFHLPKRMLVDKEELRKCIKLFRILQSEGYEGNLITHIPNNFDPISYINRLIFISNNIPNRCNLLLENVDNGNLEYLNKIDNLFCNIHLKNIENIKFCLDIGHLFFSCYKERIEKYQILKELQNFKNILLNVEEIHLHDFNNETDHLNIGKGMLDLGKISEFILRNQIKCPIIIESTIQNPNNEGIKQIKMVDELLIK